LTNAPLFSDRKDKGDALLHKILQYFNLLY